MKKILLYVGLLLASVIVLVGFSTNVVHAYGNGDVVINEFTLGAGQWIELFNNTTSNIDLAASTWKFSYTSMGPGSGTTTLSSGIIPAKGLITFAPSDFLSTTSATFLALVNNGSLIYGMSYGPSSFGGEPHLAGYPSPGQSAALTGGTNWNATTTLTKGWYNEGPAPTIDAIVALINGGGVFTNMSSTTDNTNVTSLFFEKRTNISSSTTALGRMTFAGPLNLTDASTTALLQNLGTAMQANAGKFAFNATTSAELASAGASVSMYHVNDIGGYNVSNLSTTTMIVKDDNGNILTGGSRPAFSSISTSSTNGGTFTFTTAHFTGFEFDPTVTEVTPIGTTASTSPYYTYNTNVAGTAVYAGACATTSASTTNGNNTVQFGPFSAGTYSNCTVKVIDGAGASSTLAVSSFTITNTAADLAAVAADRAALIAASSTLLGTNVSFASTTGAFSALPATGTASSSAITWASASTTLVSNDGQTVNRPAYGAGNATTTLTATITKNLTSTTTVINITVLQAGPSSNALVTSGTYTVNNASSTIGGVPVGTSKTTFLSNLATTTGESWNTASTSNPVLTGDTLVVTAQNGTTTKTYTLIVDAASNPATVNLGTSGNYVILAKSGITGGAGSTITGDMGVSPIAAASITGFALVLDSSGTFSTSSVVTGKVYAADYTAPTPSILSTAVTNMGTAYTDAAGRTADQTGIGAGNIGGLTLTRGVYKWTTGVTIPTDVILSGGANDVWIFEVAGTLNISSSKKVILTGGAQAKNVFWAVSGVATLGTSSIFNGNILTTGTSAIVVQSSATLNGRALSDGAVTLSTAIVATPATSSAKSILSFTVPNQVGTTTISEASSTVSLTVPFGTNVTALVPTITISGSSVSPASGVAQNFTSPVNYTVTGADLSTSTYAVTVTVAAASNNAKLSNLTISSGTLTPAFASTTFSYTATTSNVVTDVTFTPTASQASSTIKVNGSTVVSGSPSGAIALSVGTTTISIVVTAQDGVTISTTTVNVNRAPSNDATITSGTYTVNNASSTITNIPFGTASSTFLVALATSTGQNWNYSGLSNPVVTGNTLVIIAQDGTTTKTYTLTVALNSAKAITGFTIPSQVGSTGINQTNHTITAVMPNGTNPASLTPTITITGASVSPLSGVAHNFTSTSTYTVTAADASTQPYVATVIVLSTTQTAPDGSGNATTSSSTPEVVITNPSATTTLTVSSGITNPTINVSTFVSNGTGTLPAINLNSSLANISIPAGTVITSASTSWNGVIAAPTATTTSIPDTTGYTTTFSMGIELGFDGVKLSFDRGVRILLPNQAGKKVGYVRTGISFTEITNVCSSDSQSAGDGLGVDADCKIDASNGTDLVVWTKHFTAFATYSQTANSSGSSSSSSGSTGSSGGLVNLLAVTTPATTTITGSTISAYPATGHQFRIDLKLGASGAEVTELQKVLVAQGYLVMPAGVSMGYFGGLTKAAVIKYQLKNNISPAVGYVGSITRAQLNGGGMSISAFVNLLINLGIITADKAILLKAIM